MARALAGLGLALAVGASACGHGADVDGGDASASASSGAIDRARALVEPGTPLVSRPEAVAIADAVAIAAHAKGRSEDGLELTLLAADLRARMYRTDVTASDAREAIELYAAASLAAPSAEQACDADRRRALLIGELARDAAVTYRELFLAARRQEGRATGSREASPCLSAIETAIASAVAYRPSVDAQRTLDQDGAHALAEARQGAALPPASLPAEPALAAPPPSSSAASGDVVVSPREESIGKEPVRMLGVDPLSSEDAARVVLRLTGPATFQVGALGIDGSSDNPRVYVDIARATSRGIPHEVTSNGLVRRVRVGAHAGGTRVVLDLARPAARRAFFLPDPFRIVIDVGTRIRAEGPATAPGAPREVRRVAIDPGHGGNDAGAIGPTGLREKDVTLDIAHRVAPLLAHELGVETLLTRDNDVYVPLDLRAARANAFHADLFVSLHCNASENGGARGVQTFVLDDARDPDGVAAKVAARENSQRKALEEGDIAALSALVRRLNPAEMSARSRHVADLLQRSALASLTPRYSDTRDQGVKTAGFFVLVGAEMPAVLFETAFISNAEEEGRLATADFRQKLADAVLNAIRAYKAGK